MTPEELDRIEKTMRAAADRIDRLEQQETTKAIARLEIRRFLEIFNQAMFDDPEPK